VKIQFNDAECVARGSPHTFALIGLIGTACVTSAKQRSVEAAKGDVFCRAQFCNKNGDGCENLNLRGRTSRTLLEKNVREVCHKLLA
jgi:hypothetical protein